MTRPVDDGRNARTFGALIGLLIIAGFLLALTAMILPQALGLVIVFGGFLAIMSLHYLLWGFWLGRMLSEEEAEERMSNDQGSMTK